MKKFLITIILIAYCPLIALSQTISKNAVYLNFSAGLSRSEDGLAFLVYNSASQYAPMLNVGLGYRLNNYLGFELNGATMIGSISATGTLVSNNQQADVKARHSNLVFSPVLSIPFSTKSEFIFKVGGGLLFSQTEINSTSNPDFKQFADNFGYLVALGYSRRINEKIALSAQFDFSDSYGDKDSWRGDLGLLNIGFKYRFKNKKE